MQFDPTRLFKLQNISADRAIAVRDISKRLRDLQADMGDLMLKIRRIEDEANGYFSSTKRKDTLKNCEGYQAQVDQIKRQIDELNSHQVRASEEWMAAACLAEECSKFAKENGITVQIGAPSIDAANFKVVL